MTKLLREYISDVGQINSTGAATKKTSFYTPIANFFNRVGDMLKPKIKCVMNIKNRGAEIPGGGFFTASQLKKGEENPLQNLPPERDVLEKIETGELEINADEAREVSMIVRRVTAILLLSNDLNRNYAACRSAAFDWRKEE